MKTGTLIYRGPWTFRTIETVGAIWTTWKKSCFGLCNSTCPSPQKSCTNSFSFA